MGNCCACRRVIGRSQSVLGHWARLVTTYLGVIYSVANVQRIFSIAGLALRRRPRGLLDSASRARRLELV
jgi:hypothetical protein